MTIKEFNLLKKNDKVMVKQIRGEKIGKKIIKKIVHSSGTVFGFSPATKELIVIDYLTPDGRSARSAFDRNDIKKI